MKHIKLIRVVGRIQLILSVVLAVGCVAVYSAYRSSLGELSGALADSILSASGVINETAQTIKAQQGLIDLTTSNLLANRNLVAEVQRSAESQGKLVAGVADDLKYASSITRNVGNTVKAVGDHLFFTVPSGMHMNGWRPEIEYSMPLESQARDFQANGTNIVNISASMDVLLGTLTNDVPKLQAAFIESCRQAIQLLDQTAKATASLRSQDLPKAMTALEETSKNLRQASERARGIDRFVTSLLIAGLALACLCACNSLIVLLLANSMEPLKVNQ